MGLFHALNKSDNAKTATELASITGGDKLLIGISVLDYLCPISATHSL